MISRFRPLSGALIVSMFASCASFSASAQNTVDTILCETDRIFYAEDGWTSENADLRCSSDAAGDYALNNDGVGIVLHVGRDISRRSDAGAAPAKVQQYFINEFAKHGVAAQVFPNSNSDALATVATFHIHDHIHGAASGTEVKNLKAALEAIPDAARQLKAAKVLLQ